MEKNKPLFINKVSKNSALIKAFSAPQQSALRNLLFRLPEALGNAQAEEMDIVAQLVPKKSETNINLNSLERKNLS